MADNNNQEANKYASLVKLAHEYNLAHREFMKSINDIKKHLDKTKISSGTRDGINNIIREVNNQYRKKNKDKNNPDNSYIDEIKPTDNIEQIKKKIDNIIELNDKLI